MAPEGLQCFKDDANLAWRLARQQQLTAWGSDLFCPSPAPMFQLQLLLRADELSYVPSLQEVQHAVLGIVDAVVQAGQSVEDLGAKVSTCTLGTCYSCDFCGWQVVDQSTHVACPSLAATRPWQHVNVAVCQD
jgi:hypothetical protein